MYRQARLYYGAQYYRKPNPPRGTHRFHLEKIRNDLGFNMIRVWAMWNYVEPRPGQYDLDEVREILDLCEELDLKVVFQTCLEDAPYWMERQYPHARYVNARGAAQELSGNDNHPAGGHPGLCLDNAIVVERAAAFLHATVQAVKGYHCLAGYDCWNEPHIEPNWNSDYSATSADLLFCYCQASMDRFRAWLQAKYGSVQALNEAWARAFGEWEDVNPPRRHGNFADWLDWYRFWFDNLKRQQQWRYDVIRAADPSRFVMSHSGGVPPVLPRIESGINNFRLAQPVDLWGTSMAPLVQNWHTAETAACCDVTRSAAAGKVFWISEMQAGSGHYAGLNKAPIPEPRHIRSTNWIAAAYGAKAILYWCYLSESTGNEAPGYGLIRFNGETTPRAAEAARTWQLMQQHEALISAHQPPSDVAILYDPDSSVMLFAQEGHDRWISHSHVAYYRAVWDTDCFARWVTPDRLDDVPERVLLVPMHYLLSEQATAGIRRYVEGGGTVIAENHLGLFTSNGFQNPQVPPGGLAEVFGLEQEEGYRTWPGYQAPVGQPFGGPWAGEEYQAPTIRVTRPIAARFRAYGYLTPLRLTTAQPIGRWNGRVFAARARHGQGEAFYFGTFLGLSMFHGESGAARLVRAIIESRTAPAIRGTRLRPRLIADGPVGHGPALLCVFNNDRFAAQKDTIAIPAAFKRAEDIYTRKAVAIHRSKGKQAPTIALTVPAEDVRVLLLTP